MQILPLTFIILVNIFIPYYLNAQGITASAKSLNFGVVYENKKDSLPLVLYNNSFHDISITGVSTIKIYGDEVFSVKDSVFTITAGDNLATTIYCNIVQNVYNNSEIIFHSSNGFGDIRVDVRAQGRYSNSYYNITENVSEQALKDSLKKICSRGQISLGYDVARDSMYMVLDNERVNGQGAPVNQLHCVYTWETCSGYTDRQSLQNNFSINCEHSWPQSHFGSGADLNFMKSDMHHLFPCRDFANSIRNNHPFGIVTNPTNILQGGSLYGGGIFEPRDFHKGRVSRVLFYFVVRYDNYDNFMDQMEPVLRMWDKNFIVDNIEKKRNEDIFRMQKNRNPFVDYPSFIDRITSISQYSIKNNKQSVWFNDTLINYGQIPAYTDIIYNYVIVNTGDTAIKLTDFSLSNPQILSFAYGNNDTIIEAGEALETGIKINLTNPNPINEYFSFCTDVNSFNHNCIPVIANNYLAISTNSVVIENYKIYPNPVKDFLYIQSTDKQDMSDIMIIIKNINGKEVYKAQQSLKSDIIKINLCNFPRGTYLVDLTNNNKKLILSQKIIKY